MRGGFSPTARRRWRSKNIGASNRVTFLAHSWAMEKGAGMGKVGKTYRRAAWSNGEALQRFDRDLTEPQARELRSQIAAGVILVLVVLSVMIVALVLSPKPIPSAMPDARATTFFVAPHTSAPMTSVSV